MTEPDFRLDVEDVSVRRGERRVVEGASIVLEAGRVALLKGPNGAGKTSLLRAIAGLLPLESGRIEIRHRGAARIFPADRRMVCVHCGHLDAIKPALGLRAHLNFWARLYGGRIPDQDALLDRLGLLHLEDARAGELSAGQRRRLALCRALVADRPLWLLDEPTASMDADGAAVVLRLVGEHLGAGGAAVIATHEKIALADAKSYVLETAA